MQLNSKHVDRAAKLPPFLHLHFVNKVVTFLAFSLFCIPLMGHCHEFRNQVLKKGGVSSKLLPCKKLSLFYGQPRFMLFCPV